MDRHDCRRRPGNNYIDIGLGKISNNVGILIKRPLRPADFNDQILPFYVTTLAHTIAECLQQLRGWRHKRDQANASLSSTTALLRPCAERPHGRGSRRQLDKFAPSHVLPEAKTAQRTNLNRHSGRGQPEACYGRFGSEADIRAAKSHVRFTPEGGHVRRNYRCLLWANSGHSVFTDQGAQPKSKRLQSASLANVTAA